MPAASTVEVIAINNLGNEHVFRELEIVVRNNSPQPIYFISINVIFPDFLLPGPDGIPRSVAALLMYGRRELIKVSERATANDPPLNPGETYRFKIPEVNW